MPDARPAPQFFSRLLVLDAARCPASAHATPPPRLCTIGLRCPLVTEHFPLLEAPCSAYLDEGVLVAAAPGEPGPLIVGDADLEVGGRPGGVALHVDDDVVHMMAKAGGTPCRAGSHTPW